MLHATRCEARAIVRSKTEKDTKHILLASLLQSIPLALVTVCISGVVNGQILTASATLHGTPIAPPSGVFASARTMTMDTLTWMPEQGVRSAIVVIHYANGYVLAGRSLQLVEQRESDLEGLVALACALTLLATYIGSFTAQWLGSRFNAS